jgi:hypothetical protein
MLKHMRPGRPSAAMIVAVVAMFIALGSTGIASPTVQTAASLGKNVKKALKLGKSANKRSRRALTTARNANTTATQALAKAGQKGPKGDKGDTGARGEAVAYANVLGDGTLDSEQIKNISAGNVTRTSAGVYCFSPLSFNPKSVIVSGDNAFGVNDTLATVRRVSSGSVLTGCASTDIVRVTTIRTSDNTLQDRRFYIWFED